MRISLLEEAQRLVALLAMIEGIWARIKREAETVERQRMLGAELLEGVRPPFQTAAISPATTGDLNADQLRRLGPRP